VEKVNVKRLDLLKKLERNRERHLKQYEDAKVGYKKKLGLKVRMPIHLPQPECYVSEYDTAIGMLRMSSDHHVSVSQVEYRQFVNDEWRWKESFLSNTVAYAGLARKRK
jgi:hypothetical protein